MRGFTLLELLITLAIIAVLISSSWPSLANFYLNYQLVAERDTLIAVLRKAQSSAFTNKNQGSYGLYISAEQYTIFKGISYAGRDPAFDEKFSRSTNVGISGLSEIIFASLSAAPDRTGNFILSSGNQTLTIQINGEGTIN